MTHPDAAERQAIIAVLVTCAGAYDRRDWDALHDVFTDDALGYGVAGRRAVIEFVRRFLGGCGPSQHLLSNHEILVDGDRAASDCKARVFHVGAGGRSHLTYECLGNYRDAFVRTEQGWRIAKREFDVTIELGDSSVLGPG